MYLARQNVAYPESGCRLPALLPLSNLSIRLTRLARGVYERNAKASLAPHAEAVAAAAAAIAAGEPEHVSRDDLSHLAAALAKFAESTYGAGNG